MSHLLKTYQEKILPELMQELGFKNTHQVPRMLKIVVNMGMNDAVDNKGVIQKGLEQLSLITGRRPMVSLAKKSISAFKLRKGMPIGVKVTLRGSAMFEFWNKLVTIVLPRQRDFKGISHKCFDGQGNLNIGLKEQTIFPDIEYDKIDKTRGVEITVVTTAENNEHAQKLLERIGMPFRKLVTKK